MYISFRTKKTDIPTIYEGLVETKTGNIIARSCNIKNRTIEKKLNLFYKVNTPPSTDEDFIVLAAREAIK